MANDRLIRQIDEHAFAQYVRILGKGKKGSRSLTEDEAYAAMSMILNDQAEDLQIGAFLMLLRVKEESPEELSGFVKAVKEHIQAPTDVSVDLDWSSYAGKRRHLPWFVFSVMLLAQAGHRVLMHGASGHTTNRLYTEDLMLKLGLPVASSWQECSKQLDESHFTYLPLRHICPSLAKMINMRSLLGLRSPVHSLSRLINPLNASTVLQGVFHPPYSQLHQEAGKLLGYSRLTVLKGEGGEIERNPDNVSKVYCSWEGQLVEEEWPSLFARRHVKPAELNQEHMQAVWRGKAEDEYAFGAITSTCALALRSMDAQVSQESALEKAQALWLERDLERI